MARVILGGILLVTLICATIAFETVRQGMLFVLIVIGVWFMYRLQEFSSGHKDFVRKTFSKRREH